MKSEKWKVESEKWKVESEKVGIEALPSTFYTDDAALNDSALLDGGRLFSVYNTPSGLYDSESKIWIITEHDRSYTTVLFPSDY